MLSIKNFKDVTLKKVQINHVIGGKNIIAKEVFVISTDTGVFQHHWTWYDDGTVTQHWEGGPLGNGEPLAQGERS